MRIVIEKLTLGEKATRLQRPPTAKTGGSGPPGERHMHIWVLWKSTR
jgi:hypothetical protein